MSTLTRQHAGKRVLICAGAGGVGKTTVSAAIALGLAAQGRRVALVTIDPARRLAEALGLDELGNEPRRVDPARLASAGQEIRGELSAMMLDATRTFDDLIARLAPDAPMRDRILANPIYQHLSTAVAGSQEYAAIAKLFDLVHDADYETVVLDTPPSRSAIAFLDAPERLIGFIEGRALAAFLKTGGALRAAGVVFAALRRITGVGLLEDLMAFFGLLSGLLDGFRTRAADVRALLTDRATGFLIITTPERAAVDEAIRFAAELEHARMHRCGVIVNRFHCLDRSKSDPTAIASRLAPALGHPLADTVARVHTDVQLLARRDHAAVLRLQAGLGQRVTVCLADRDRDLHDVEGLADLHQELVA